MPGGKATVQRWYQRWDHTAASLQHKKGAGRPAILTAREVQTHITMPIRRCNRSAQRVRYSQLAEAVREKTGKQIADRTIRQIGKEQVGAKRTRGRKRTAEECK